MAKRDRLTLQVPTRRRVVETSVVSTPGSLPLPALQLVN
jgi:hypothetical protein